MPVIDASVYVALINEKEPAYDRCWRWLNQTRNRRERISAPLIFPVEVAAAVSRGMSDTRLAHKLVARLVQTRLIQLVPVTTVLAERAATIAAEYRIRGCDAVYVALAEQLDDELITLDRQQLERGAAVATTRQPSL